MSNSTCPLCKHCRSRVSLPAKAVTVFFWGCDGVAVWSCPSCGNANLTRGLDLLRLGTEAAYKVWRRPAPHTVAFVHCRTCDLRIAVPGEEILVVDPEPDGGPELAVVACHVCGQDVHLDQIDRARRKGAQAVPGRLWAMVEMLRDPEYQPHAAMTNAWPRWAA